MSSRRSGATNRTIQAGFHILVPFIDRIAYKHNLKEEAMMKIEKL
jgi:regulator of protease activity HflC (stomatin/prohibitin superfamily)